MAGTAYSALERGRKLPMVRYANNYEVWRQNRQCRHTQGQRDFARRRELWLAFVLALAAMNERKDWGHDPNPSSQPPRMWSSFTRREQPPFHQSSVGPVGGTL